ncbi:Hypothetical protein NTJ_07018 [Nesidiocoris tenuis]|uniref:Uncharacterized protein n=1 Tax=Nesidiocoris tenuis TaxID=355587 RepID=A0ABN7APS2_9HEMI|nr:Hypothetical protein NTJ_07018 [Nesidiocoris tenuis]
MVALKYGSTACDLSIAARSDEYPPQASAPSRLSCHLRSARHPIHFATGVVRSRGTAWADCGSSRAGIAAPEPQLTVAARRGEMRTSRGLNHSIRAQLNFGAERGRHIDPNRPALLRGAVAGARETDMAAAEGATERAEATSVEPNGRFSRPGK